MEEQGGGSPDPAETHDRHVSLHGLMLTSRVSYVRGRETTGVNIWAEHKLLNCRMFSRMSQLIAWRHMGCGVSRPRQNARPQVSPIAFPLQSRSDPGGVGRPCAGAKLFHES